MSRHLVRSFILASVLGPFVNAGPCKPFGSSTIMRLTTTESTEIAVASSSTVVASTSETYTLTSRSEDASTTTAESPSSTGSESVLFTTTAETFAISSGDTTVSQSETVTAAVSEASTTASSDFASDTTTETAGDTTTEISVTISSDESSVVSQTATATTLGDTTTTILESSTTEEILPTTTNIATLTSEAPTTTIAEDVTLTSTEPFETTTGVVVGCKEDKINPPPENLVCGKMGGRTTNAGYIGLGQTPSSELDCAEECRNTATCKFFAVQAGQFGFCELWSQVNPTSNFASTYKWYELGCFCGSSETEPETTTTQAPEVLPTTTDITSETESPTTTTTEDVTLTSTEPIETTTEAAAVCIDNKKSPPPEDLACSIMGYSLNTEDARSLGMGRSGSELECAEDCRNNPDCKFFAVQTGSGGFCQLWTGVFSPSDDETSWRWYEPGCFCDSSEPESEATQTQEPEP